MLNALPGPHINPESIGDVGGIRVEVVVYFPTVQSLPLLGVPTYHGLDYRYDSSVVACWVYCRDNLRVDEI